MEAYLSEEKERDRLYNISENSWGFQPRQMKSLAPRECHYLRKVL